MNVPIQMTRLGIHTSLSKVFIDTLVNCIDLYFTHGARSSKKVIYSRQMMSYDSLADI